MNYMYHFWVLELLKISVLTRNKISKFQCYTNQIVADVGDLNQGKIDVHELEPTHGDQTACESLVNKTNYHKADWNCSELFHT